MIASGAPVDVRVALGRHLVGQGLEIGPGHRPYPLVFGGATARYVDRWDTDTNRRLFREVEDADFVEPDVVANLDTDRLSAFDDCSVDFVIASHVLEHLAEPIGMLQDVHRVLTPGGVLLLFLPDRLHTFDRSREPTSLAHLVDEFDRGVTVVDDAHLEEFIANTDEDWGSWGAPADDAERFERHRLRSIHVHCWTEAEFSEVIVHTIGELGLGWELVDRLSVGYSDDATEFGLVLRRPTVVLAPAAATARFGRVWDAVGAAPRPSEPRPSEPPAAPASTGPAPTGPAPTGSPPGRPAVIDSLRRRLRPRRD